MNIELWWTLPFRNIKIGRTNVKLSNAIVDSGSSLFFAGAEVVKDVRKALKIDPKATMLNCRDADKLPTIYFEINGDSFAVENNYYIYRYMENG